MQSPRRQLIDLDLDSSNVYSFDHIENGLVTDSSELFQLNLQKQPLSWLYRQQSVNYTVNGQHYRCRPFDQIDWANSVVIFGCSNAFGQGLDNADTISSKLEQVTGIPVVNLGVGGSSQQFSLYNQLLLTQRAIVPRAIIHIWTDSCRPLSVDENGQFHHHGPWNRFGLSSDAELALWNNITGKYKTHVVTAMFNRMISNSIAGSCPVLHATHFVQMHKEQLEQYPLMPMLLMPKIDLARDLIHPGIKSNLRAAGILAQQLGL
jgi:hypothetical protein